MCVYIQRDHILVETHRVIKFESKQNHNSSSNNRGSHNNDSDDEATDAQMNDDEDSDSDDEKQPSHEQIDAEVGTDMEVREVNRLLTEPRSPGDSLAYVVNRAIQAIHLKPSEVTINSDTVRDRRTTMVSPEYPGLKVLCTISTVEVTTKAIKEMQFVTTGESHGENRISFS